MEDREYQSTEEKVFNAFDRKIRNVSEKVNTEIETFGEVAYACFSIPFRIPTVIRKLKDDTAMMMRKKPGDFRGSATSAIFGAVTGVGTILLGAGYTVHEAVQGNYLPAAILGATNLASGIFEVLRSPGKKDLETTVAPEIKEQPEEK